MKIPLAAHDGVLNPFESRCQLAYAVEARGGVLRAARGAVEMSFDQASSLVVADTVYWDDSPCGFGWGDVAFFVGVNGWKAKRGATTTVLTAPAAPVLRGVGAYYARAVLGADWFLSGATGGANAVPNGDFRSGNAGWNTLAGTVQYGGTGTGGFAAWFRGAGGGGGEFPQYAGFRSDQFPIDKSKSYFLSYKHICEPYDRFTYDGQEPRLVVRVRQYDSSGNPVGTNPVLEDQVDSTRLHATGRGEWHTHREFAGAVQAHTSSLSPRWHADAARAAVEVWCNFNKHRITDIRLEEGAAPSVRVEDGRLVYRWEFPASADGANVEVYVKCDVDTARAGSLRLGLLRVRGLPTPADDSVQIVLEDGRGERYAGRILGYYQKEAYVGDEYAEVVWRDVEVDLTPLQGGVLKHLGVSMALAALPSGSYRVEVGSVVSDGGDSESGRFAVLVHGRVPQGVQKYLLTRVVQVGAYELESAPVSFEVSLRQFSSHGVRVWARGSGRLRLYRLIDGAYHRVAEAEGSESSDVVLVDDGVEVGEVYRQSGVLPAGDVCAVWMNRVVVGRVGERVVWVSGEGEPLRYAESGLLDTDALTVVFPEAVRALDARADGVLVYGVSRRWIITRYAPLMVFELRGFEPSSSKAVHQGWVADGEAVYDGRGRRVRWLPEELRAPAVLRVGLDGSVLVAKDELVEVLTESGWVRYSVLGAVRDAVFSNGFWVVATGDGVYRLAVGARVSGGLWRSGRFSAEGYSRPFWVWVMGSAWVRYRDGAGTERQARVAWGRWQVPVSQAARWWELELALEPDDVVYELRVEAGQVGGVR